jgi:Bax inhibitor 1
MSGFGSSMDFQEALKFQEISPRTQAHLSKVYMVLTGLAGSCALGVSLNIMFHIGGFLSFLSGIFCLLYVIFTNEKSSGRLVAVLLFGLLEGLNIGPLVEVAAEIDPAIVLTALLASLGIFTCFSIAALKSDRSQNMYLGAVLSSCMLILSIISLLRLFGLANFDFISLYLGLFVFMGYVVYDTQLIIIKSEQGEKDYHLHTLNLFADLIQIFIRILVILMKKSSEGKKKD